jgi:Tol biopolymer transport system component
MTQRDDLDRLLSAWLDDPYTPPAPHYLGRVLERTRNTRQRPAWASLERWLPMADKVLQPTTAPPLRTAWLLIIALLVLALAFGAVVVGSRLLQSTPIPQGGAAVFTFGSYVGNEAGQTGGEIYTVRADGTDLRRLTDGPGIKSSPIFSPDGTRIAYRVHDAAGDSVAVIDAGGRNRTTLATSVQSGFDCADRPSLAWSPDGTSLLFATRTGLPSTSGIDCTYDLKIVAADGSGPAHRLLAPGVNSVFGSWSPDGTQIAFLGSDAGRGNGLYVVDVGAGGASGGLQGRRIGPDLGPPQADAHAPRWSPDGTELAVVVVKQGFFIVDAEGIYVVKADGSEQRLVAARAGNPAWSPDGLKIAFHRTVDPAEYFNERPCTVRMWIVDADGSDERRLEPRAEGCEIPPRWSPDGTRLAGLLISSTPTDPNPAPHLGIVTVDGSSPPVILQDADPGSWQPFAAPLPPPPSFAPQASTSP